jgi:DNA replication and repair protein RecF
MIINKIKIENFRNYKKEEILFTNKINYILGNNAQGKTNLLESIFFILNNESFKSIKEDELFNEKSNSKNLNITLEINKEEKNYLIELEKNENKKIYKINGVKKDFRNKIIKTIIFVPDDLQIVKEGPGKRRDFLDNEIKILFPNYKNLIKNYYKLLSQKNYLLKNRRDKNLIKTFNIQLSETGKEIIKYRLFFLKNITPIARKIYNLISEKNEILSINYKPSFNFNNYQQELDNNLENEMIKKQSLIGIHRDDIVFYINGKNTRSFASQGQQRSVILSLKIAELEYLKKYYNYFPILLLDDVFSELDEKRKNMLIKILKENNIQSFITLANIELIKNQISENDKIIIVNNGKIEENIIIGK